MSAGLDDLRAAFAELTALHGWAPLQTPRNLLLALTGRVGAVASIVQWQADIGPGAGTPELRDGCRTAWCTSWPWPTRSVSTSWTTP